MNRNEETNVLTFIENRMNEINGNVPLNNNGIALKNDKSYAEYISRVRRRQFLRSDL